MHQANPEESSQEQKKPTSKGHQDERPKAAKSGKAKPSKLTKTAISIDRLAAFASKLAALEKGEFENLSEQRLVEAAIENRREIDLAIETFLELGGYPEPCLLRGFNQEGTWFRLRDDLGRLIDGSQLCEKSIALNRTTTFDGKGQTHLLTSFVSFASGKIEIPYASIAGEVHVPNAESFCAENLRSVGYGLFLPNARWVSIPKLSKIGRDQCPEIAMFFGGLIAPKVPNLEAPELKEIQGEVLLPKAKKIFFPRLKSIFGWLMARSALSILCPKLQQVKDILLLPKIPKEQLLDILMGLKPKELEALLKNPSMKMLLPLLPQIQAKKTEIELSKEMMMRPPEPSIPLPRL